MSVRPSAAARAASKLESTPPLKNSMVCCGIPSMMPSSTSRTRVSASPASLVGASSDTKSRTLVMPPPAFTR